MDDCVGDDGDPAVRALARELDVSHIAVAQGDTARGRGQRAQRCVPTRSGSVRARRHPGRSADGETVPTPSDGSPAVSSANLALEITGAVQLAVAGIAVRVVLCNLGGDDVAAAMAEVADLTEIVPIRTEHDDTDRYTVIVGPLRS